MSDEEDTVEQEKPFLVGERGPELLTLDGRGGTITTAARPPRGPITVNLSQEQIAEIASVEIARRAEDPTDD